MNRIKNRLGFVGSVLVCLGSIGAGVWVLSTTDGSTMGERLGILIPFVVICLIPCGFSWWALLFFRGQIKNESMLSE